MHKYEVLHDALLERIRSGMYRPGEKLISDEAIAEAFDVSLITVRRAMTQLQEEGHIRRIRGQGSFVSEEDTLVAPDYKPLIALLVTQESYTAASLTPIITGIQAALARHGFTLLIEWNSHNPRIERVSIERMLDQQVSGFLIYPYDPVQNREEYDILRNLQIPFVLLDRYDYGSPAHFVGSSNYDGGILAVEALRGLGHTKIKFVGSLFFLSSEQERYAGYCHAMRNAGLHFGDDMGLIADADFPRMAGQIRNGEITALFCCSDRMARKTVLGLEEQGIRVPQDVSVFGFDDCVYAPETLVPLSTIHQNYEGIGSTGAELLLSLIRGERPLTPPVKLLTDVHVVLRESTRAL